MPPDMSAAMTTAIPAFLARAALGRPGRRRSCHRRPERRAGGYVAARSPLEGKNRHQRQALGRHHDRQPVANRYWGEGDGRGVRSVICTCTLIQGDKFRLLVDPSLADAGQMTRELDRRTGLKIADVTELRYPPARRPLRGPRPFRRTAALARLARGGGEAEPGWQAARQFGRRERPAARRRRRARHARPHARP